MSNTDWSCGDRLRQQTTHNRCTTDRVVVVVARNCAYPETLVRPAGSAGDIWVPDAELTFASQQASA